MFKVVRVDLNDRTHIIEARFKEELGDMELMHVQPYGKDNMQIAFFFRPSPMDPQQALAFLQSNGEFLGNLGLNVDELFQDPGVTENE